jgi:hypothetical protein
MSLFGIRGINQAGLGLAAITFAGGEAEKSEIAIFQKELGLTVKDNITEATIRAFQDPQAAAVAYKKARLEIDKLAVELYKKSGAQAVAAGLSQDEAMIYAKKRAVAFHNAELELLNLTHPYASTGEGLVALASGAKRQDLLKK